MTRRVPELALTAALTTACAPIDATSELTLRPREAPIEVHGEERVSHEFVADYVQLGSRLLVELSELDQCVATRHIPVLRVERVERSNRGFVAWDFALGVGAGAFSALAFAKPRAFTKPLVDGQGRVVYDTSSAYIIGGVFAALSAGLLAAGVVNAVRSRDSTHYAEAFEVEYGPPRPCATLDGGTTHPLGERELSLFVAEGVLEAHARSDASGRARFELPPWPQELPGGMVSAVIEISQATGEGLEPKLLELSLRAPFTAMQDAHTGRADTRTSSPNSASALAPSPAPEGPQP